MCKRAFCFLCKCEPSTSKIGSFSATASWILKRLSDKYLYYKPTMVSNSFTLKSIVFYSMSSAPLHCGTRATISVRTLCIYPSHQSTLHQVCRVQLALPSPLDCCLLSLRYSPLSLHQWPLSAHMLMNRPFKDYLRRLLTSYFTRPLLLWFLPVFCFANENEVQVQGNFWHPRLP